MAAWRVADSGVALPGAEGDGEEGDREPLEDLPDTEDDDAFEPALEQRLLAAVPGKVAARRRLPGSRRPGSSSAAACGWSRWWGLWFGQVRDAAPDGYLGPALERTRLVGGHA